MSPQLSPGQIPTSPLSGTQPGTSTPSSAPPNSVAEAFGKYVENTNDDQIVSDQAIRNLIEGKTNNVQDVVMAVAKAEMSFQMFMEIRNRLVESYNELMRIQF